MPPILDHPQRMPLWDAVSRSGGGWRSGWGKRIARLSMPLKRLLERWGRAEARDGIERHIHCLDTKKQ